MYLKESVADNKDKPKKTMGIIERSWIEQQV